MAMTDDHHQGKWILISGLVYFSALLWKGSLAAGDEYLAPHVPFSEAIIMQMYGYSVFIQLHVGPKATRACTGTIITQFSIVTSARCVFQGESKILGLSKTDVIAGTIIGTHGNKEKMEKIIPHPHYNETEYHRVNDLAVINLAVPMEVNLPPSNILRHAIATVEIGPDVKLAAGSHCYLSVYGSPNTKVPDRSILVPMVVHHDSECAKAYPKQNYDHNLQICVGLGNSTIKIQCDSSGGSLFCKDQDDRIKFFGIMSKSIDKPPVGNAITTPCYEKERRPMVFTRVTKYKSWIDENLRKH